ncbi:MAG TPA: dTMP kinase [Candidatus Dormibacteraeota bacterium]|nr:dTMP kinase [Candidatus Dormibacteraeota bacterium]
MTPGPGVLVSVEGVDGSGKSTQVAALSAAVTAAGRRVTVVREPGGTDVGELLRDLVLHRHFGTPVDPWTEALLMVAARAQLLFEVVRPALGRGDVVVADRFVDSTLAYQGGGRGLDQSALRRLHRDACGDVWPDLTVLLALPLDAAAARRRADRLPLDRMETDVESDFGRRVADAFAALAAAEPARIAVVDAGLPAREVAARVWDVVSSRIGAVAAVR